MTAPGSKIGTCTECVVCVLMLTLSRDTVLSVNPFAEWVAELEGCETLEMLQDSKNDKASVCADCVVRVCRV
jgi:hypothetical protein